jgi:hypothetical protein
MAVIEIARIQVRRGLELQTGVPNLAPGEFGWAEDTERLYIGHSVSEGGISDGNTRILTEHDLANVFALVYGQGTSVASTATYRYRDDLPYNELHSNTIRIANKLDTTVSLVDYGAVTNTVNTLIATAGTSTNINVLFSTNLLSTATLGSSTLFLNTLSMTVGVVITATSGIVPGTTISGISEGSITISAATNDNILAGASISVFSVSPLIHNPSSNIVVSGSEVFVDGISGVLSGTYYAQAVDANSFLLYYDTNLEYPLISVTNSYIAGGSIYLVQNAVTDITMILNTAIQDLFNNQYLGKNINRKLIIPAGVYNVNPSELAHGHGVGIYLPPNTKLVGEGSGLTTLLLSNTVTNMFQNVDAAGNYFQVGSMAMQTSGQESKNIVIEGMTLCYSTTTYTDYPLLELDQASNVYLEDVEFNTKYFNGFNTLTEITSSFGSGIYMRGGSFLPPNEQSKNVIIENCSFNNIGTGVIATGTVVNSKIENSVFENLQQGINFNTDTGNNQFGYAPRDFIISRNNFRNISSEAIFVGTSTNRANHISQGNTFFQVGNGGIGFNDNVTTSSGMASILTFYGEGCRSLDDDFSRRDYAYYIINHVNNISTTTFYYYPLITGNATIENNNIYSSTTTSKLNTVNVDIFYAPTNPQLLSIPYTMAETINNYSRSGELTINITPSTIDYINSPTIYSSAASGTIITIFQDFWAAVISTATNTSTFILSLDPAPTPGDYFYVNSQHSVFNLTQTANTGDTRLYFSSGDINSINIQELIVDSPGTNLFFNTHNPTKITQINNIANAVFISNPITEAMPVGTPITFWYNPKCWIYNPINADFEISNLLPAGNIYSLDSGDYVNTTTDINSTIGTFTFINIISQTVTATSTASWLLSLDNSPGIGDAYTVNNSTIWVYTSNYGWVNSGSTNIQNSLVLNLINTSAYSAGYLANLNNLDIFRHFLSFGTISDYYSFSATSSWTGFSKEQIGDPGWHPTFSFIDESVQNNCLTLQITTNANDNENYVLQYSIKTTT